MNRTAYLFACHYVDDGILDRFRKLREAIGPNGDVYVLFHEKEGGIPDSLADLPLFAFSYEALSELGYPMFGESLVPGSTHFPLILFRRRNPGYRRYWYIEYDVRYAGRWQRFFSYWNRAEEDFLTSHIRRYEEEPQWCWWRLEHPEENLPPEERLRSFNTVYRISDCALDFVDSQHELGWKGHDEVLLASLLHRNGFSLRDFGGTGSFVRFRDRKKFYIDLPNDPQGILLAGTMRCGPDFGSLLLRRNKLYHPFKESKPWWRLIPLRFNLRQLKNSRFIPGFVRSAWRIFHRVFKGAREWTTAMEK